MKKVYLIRKCLGLINMVEQALLNNAYLERKVKMQEAKLIIATTKLNNHHSYRNIEVSLKRRKK